MTTIHPHFGDATIIARTDYRDAQKAVAQEDLTAHVPAATLPQSAKLTHKPGSPDAVKAIGFFQPDTVDGDAYQALLRMALTARNISFITHPATNPSDYDRVTKRVKAVLTAKTKTQRAQAATRLYTGTNPQHITASLVNHITTQQQKQAGQAKKTGLKPAVLQLALHHAEQHPQAKIPLLNAILSYQQLRYKTPPTETDLVAAVQAQLIKAAKTSPLGSTTVPNWVENMSANAHSPSEGPLQSALELHPVSATT